jgi:hypothetical protein
MTLLIFINFYFPVSLSIYPASLLPSLLLCWDYVSQLSTFLPFLMVVLLTILAKTQDNNL